MALHIHRAERTDLLADGLGALLATPPADAFAQDLVIVPAKGVERWLSQRLSHILGRGERADGVCAGISFRNPRSLIAGLLELGASGADSWITGSAGSDPWSPDALVWPLLEAVDASLDEPWCATLAAHLGHFERDDEKELRLGRRFAVARRLAGLFSSYARQRPGLLAGWQDGDDGSVDADLGWQPPLWRALVARVDAEPPDVRHAGVLARLRESPVDLPERLSLFGHTRLPGTEVELLEALSTHHDLHLWLPHPSDALWHALAPLYGAVPRREDTGHRHVGHPLLATLGRDLRELQRMLPTAGSDEHVGAAARPDTLLGWLQSDMAANTVLRQGRSMSDDDRSVQVHSCHGAARQIDVLREVLLGLLTDDPTLEPRDILVMCPDIETYAPLINADFGLGDVVHGAHPAHQLRVRLADRALVQTNPLLGVTAQVLALAAGRVTASEVLDLAQAEPVRARFGFTDDDLEDITDWVRQANIRWGFDREHRTPFGVDFVHNTWRFGIDRVLAGVAMSDDSHAWLDATLPLDDVSSNRVELAGRFAEYVSRLQRVVDDLTGVRPSRKWLAALSEGIGLLARADDDDAWQSTQLQREFNTVLANAGARGDTPLRLPDIRALLDRQLAGRPTRANFRTGTLTVCTMVPMRSVPHRVVCLVGLDDGVFPRLGVVDGDDALARDPVTGERDIRSEDRQLLLDAIGAATEKLVVTYTGANEYSGQRKPPAVPLVELLDTLDITTEQPVRTRVLIEHPLQPFDIRNVTPGELGMPAATPFTFDTTALTAAEVASGRREDRPPFLSGALPAPAPDDVALDDLLKFFKDPVKGFFTALDYTLPWDIDPVEDAMPVEIDKLQEWTVGDRMLDDMLRGMTAKEAQQAEWRRGTLPPGNLGWRKATELRDSASALADAAARHRAQPPQAYDVDVDIGGGRRVSGTVPRVYGDRLVWVTYSKLDGRHLLASWIQLVALTAAHPRRGWTAVCIGRPRNGSRPRERMLGPPQDHAVDVLADLVAMYDAGRRAPIPLPLKTSYAWAETRHTRGQPERQAMFKWQSGKFPGDCEEPAHELVWGRKSRLEVLLTPVLPGEEYDGETTRLGAYAARLWLPMLIAERDPD